MGSLIGFFAGGPARLQALLIGAIAMLLACAALTIWALWERSGRLGATVQLTAAVAQQAVLADKLGQCDAGTAEAKRVGDAAIAAMGGLVAAARKQHEGSRQQVMRIEDLLAKPPPAGASCEDAWRAIEAARDASRPISLPAPAKTSGAANDSGRAR